MNEPRSAAVSITNSELVSVRDAMRELGRLLERLDTGEIDKLVLTQKNQLRAVMVSVERYAELASAVHA